MSSQTKPIRVLLYEDNSDYAASFKTSAQQARIIIDVVDNVDDLLEKIKSAPRRYQFVVLDARAYMHEGQQEGTENEMNLMTVVREFDLMGKQDGIVVPYCINTGFADLRLRLSGNVNCKIFEKGSEPEVFEYIWNTHNDSDRARTLKLYPEIMEFAEQYFADADYNILEGLFIKDKFKSSHIVDRVSNLSCLRRTVEHLMDIMHSECLNNKSGIISSSGSRLRELTDYLQTKEGMPVHVYSTLTSIRKIASTYGSHTPTTPEAIDAYPSAEYVTGLSISLKDTFKWAKSKI